MTQKSWTELCAIAFVFQEGSKVALKKPATKKAKSAKRRVSKTGIYTAPSGNVSISVPTFWMFRQTNDDLQLIAPSGDVSLIVNAYSSNNHGSKLDARDNLEHLLESIPKQARVKRDAATNKRAAARYKDSEGNSWCVEFITDGKLLLLAEVSSTGALTTPEAKTALGALDSLKIKAR
jgi:hypothetical protein